MESGTINVAREGKEAWLRAMGEIFGGEFNPDYFSDLADSIGKGRYPGILPEYSAQYSIVRVGDDVHATAGEEEYVWRVKA